MQKMHEHCDWNIHLGRAEQSKVGCMTHHFSETPYIILNIQHAVHDTRYIIFQSINHRTGENGHSLYYLVLGAIHVLC